MVFKCENPFLIAKSFKLFICQGADSIIMSPFGLSFSFAWLNIFLEILSPSFPNPKRAFAGSFLFYFLFLILLYLNKEDL